MAKNDQKLDGLQRLLVKAVLENTVDQLAIVSGTLQHVLTLPHNQLNNSGSSHAPTTSHDLVHWNKSDKPLEELLLREHREKQKIVSTFTYFTFFKRLYYVVGTYYQATCTIHQVCILLYSLNYSNTSPTS